MDSDSIHNNSVCVKGGAEAAAGPSQQPRTQSPLQRILPELLPTIMSYLRIPHLQYRLVSKEWDHAMKTLHSLGECSECEVRVGPEDLDELLIRMQALTYHMDSNQQAVAWMLRYKIDGLDHVFAEAELEHIESHLIPYLDTVQHSSCCTINLEFGEEVDYDSAVMFADWSLKHSKPSKYNFFVSFFDLLPTRKEFLRFVHAPSMRHVIGLVLSPFSGYRFSFTPFRDVESVSALSTLKLSCIDFRSRDAECLLQSPFLNLKHLSFFDLYNLKGMLGAHRTIGLDTIICSPIMKSVTSFGMSHIRTLGYSPVEAFAHSEYLKNLTHLKIGHSENKAEWSLEPLLRCDNTLPALTVFTFGAFSTISVADMNVIASPTSALFNRIERLDLSDSTIPIEAIQVLCNSDGLRALKSLLLRFTFLTDDNLQLFTSASLSHFENLEYLCVANNYELTNQSVVALYSSKNMPKLQHIDFTRCSSLHSGAMEDICELPPRANLRRLSFDFDVSEATKAKLQTIAPQLRIESKPILF